MKQFLRRSASLTLACLFALVNGSALLVNTAKVGATPYSAEVYLTLADQSKLVEKQADVPFATDVAPAANELDVRVDPTKTFQTMDGVGATMTESSAYLFSEKLTAAQRSLVFPALFSKQNGAGIDVVRVPWGATDFSLSYYTYNDLPDGQQDVPQNNFSINHDSQYIIPRLLDARSVNPDLKLFFAPWSPPRWMKTNIIPLPGEPLATGNLNPSLYGSYATYLAKAINGYTANWLWPYAFTPQNHPTILTTHPSMMLSAQNEIDLIKNNLGPTVNSGTMAKPKILAHDEDWSKAADFALPVLGDSQAASYTSGVAFHCYNGEPTKQLLVQKAYPNKEIHFTECTGSNTAPENWDDDFRWGMRNLVINATRDYAKSVIYWNLALDENAGPKSSPNAGCQNCRGVIKVTSTGQVSTGPEYYILSHYGKFIYPGATRIDSTTYGEGSIETTAFKNPDGSKVLIALNSGSTARTFSVREGNASLSYTLPAGAAATFKWSMPDNTSRDVDTGRIEAENYASSVPANVEKIDITDAGRQDKAARMTNDQQIRFDNIAFQGVPTSFQMRYRTLGSGTVELHQDTATGPLLASIPFTPTDWNSSGVIAATTTPTAGTHAVYAVVKHTSPTAIDINWFKFAENAINANPIAGKSGWKAYGVYGGGSDVPSNVFDDNNNTRWTTGYPMTYGHWFTVDLGKQTALNAIGAYSANGDRPHNVKVEVSDNGIDYTTVQTGYSPPADLYQIPFTSNAMGRYVRITELSDTPVANWWSMNEVNMYYH